MPSEVMSMQEPDNPVIPGPGLLSTGRYIHFGPFRIDQQRQEVTRNGARLKLQGKVYQTLLTLLEKPGEVVTREELRDQNWPADTFVDFDNSLNTAINKLREALGDSADSPRFIETLPRRGYRFIAEPGEINPQFAQLPEDLALAPNSPLTKIAVTALERVIENAIVSFQFSELPSHPFTVNSARMIVWE